MALTHHAFQSAGTRAEAFVLSLFGLRGTLRRLGRAVVDWHDAGAMRAVEAERHRRDALALARELRNDLDVLIAELEVPAIEPRRREVA